MHTALLFLSLSLSLTAEDHGAERVGHAVAGFVVVHVRPVHLQVVQVPAERHIYIAGQ